MTEAASLFARYLRQHRIEHGRHGRMTQDDLAEALGVSVDAVSKYERSLSYIRGDLEHRLAERLGWSRDRILACREDWERNRESDAAPAYRVFDDTILDEVFGGSIDTAVRDCVEFSGRHMGELPEDFAANVSIFAPISKAFRDNWEMVLFGGRIVAQWLVIPLLPEDEDKFRAGALLESDLSADRVRQTLLPGTCFAYSPALVVAPGHERAASLLLSSFVTHLEDLARRDVLYHGLGTINVTPAGAQICRDLGMTRLRAHRTYPDFGVWNMPGAAIATSIFARRSRLVREAYSAAFL